MKTLEILSPLMGSVTMIFAETGAEVKEGDKLMGIECMKMQYDIEAPHSGTVEIKVELGDIVGQDSLLGILTIAD